MIILPAIDLRNGQAVRLTQGDYNRQDTYFDDVLALAQRYKDAGFDKLHVVDLDAAKEGSRCNATSIKQITSVVSAELGGGIRCLADCDAAFDLGVSNAIIGTAAVKDPGFVKDAVAKYGEKIIVSIDAKNGKVATHGWQQTSDVDALEFALKMREIGVKTIVYTDISKDGMLCGPNFVELERMHKESGLQVIASGGISCIEDVQKVKQMGLYACIVGKALYEGKISLDELASIK
ncbi:MAG: 1-(5-phosphoribosyl)-5-[(5-phosphoribosylamino)methylideneamino]imidazole-4-carboxamide isomerase [Coriobacteriales bacterium]|nr:1-(5-phosphoribosyl)-5-[(5-phosphoribosylamino)methylideneamino]imidazole-4-carboxamide isomerase [Coriobacteriales bacterium]